MEPPRRIVAQARLERPRIAQRRAVGVAAALRALFDQAVFNVVEEDAAPVRGEVAVRVIAERRAPRSRIVG